MIDHMRPFLQIPNHHFESCGIPPTINGGDNSVYVGYFESKYGDQWVFTYDWRTKTAQLRGGDVGWDTVYTVDESGRVPDLILAIEEQLWLRACWDATNVA